MTLYGLRSGNAGMVRAGLWQIVTAIGLFAAGFLFFEGLLDTLYWGGRQHDLTAGWVALWQEAVFAGERCRYLLQAADGTSMVLKEPSSAAIRRRAVGEQAEIAWSVADTILV